MASNTPTSAKCSLCSELYVDPRMLPCLHTFCGKCLKKKAEEQDSESSLKCPTCDKTTSLPDGGVNALPKDLRKGYEAEIATYASKIQSEEEISCDQCVDVSSGSAVSFCIECCEFLCKGCVQHHKKWRKTLNHELQPVGGAKSTSKETAEPLKGIPHKPMSCQLHEDETLKFFCKTCCLLICRDCVICEHSGHTYSRVEKVAEREKADLISHLESASGAKSELDDAIAKGGKIVQQIQAKQKSVEEDIETAFKTLQEALQERKKVLLAKAAEISLGKQTALAMQGEELKGLSDEIGEICEMITSATQVYTPAEMLSVKGAMASKLKQLVEHHKEVNLEPCRSDNMPSVLNTSELVEKIVSFGMVLGGSDPTKAKTDLHIARAIVNKERKVTISTYDIEGKPFSLGGEEIEVKLSLLGSNYPPLQGAVVDNRDGTYVATFTPSACGEHELSIAIENQEVKGSPFVMHVRQDRSYANLSSYQRVFSSSSYVIDVAVDDNGDVYVAVYGYHCIDVFNKEGTKLRSIGTPGSNGSENGQFYNPFGIAIRGSVLYVVDQGNNRIQKMTTSGKFISKFGTSGSGAGQLSTPRGICLDRDGRVFVSDSGNNRVSVFEADGTFACHITGNFSGPWGLTFDPSGNLQVANYGNGYITIFSPEGNYITQYNSQVTQPAGIAIDVEGHTVIGENYNSGYSRVAILNSSHQLIRHVQSFCYAVGVAIDKEGSVYVCNFNQNQVYKY